MNVRRFEHFILRFLYNNYFEISKYYYYTLKSSRKVLIENKCNRENICAKLFVIDEEEYRVHRY